MKCSTKYVGLDVHQSTTLATVRQASGKIIARSVLPNEDAALLEFFAGMRGAVHIASRACHCSALTECGLADVELKTFPETQPLHFWRSNSSAASRRAAACSRMKTVKRAFTSLGGTRVPVR